MNRSVLTMVEKHEEELIKSALGYAARGKPVFPCKPDRTPRTRSGFKDATTDREVITHWWGEHPDSLIGMPTGEPSCLVVLDVDNKNGHDGDESLHQLQRKHSKLPITIEVLTPNGGRHLYFQYPGLPIKSTASSIGDGLDIRGDGGYVVVPPSRIGEKGYEWEASNPDEAAPMPGWLIDLTKKGSRTKGTATGGASVGSRNNHLTSVAGAMRRAGMDLAGLIAGLLAENEKFKPALGRDEVEKIAASVAGYPTGDTQEPQKNVFVPLDVFELPALKSELLPPPLRWFAQALSEHTETPIELPVSMVLAAVATTVQGRYRLMVKPGYFEPLNIWPLCALDPGNRKSSVVDAAIAPLLAWEQAEAERLAPDIREAEQLRKVDEAQAENLRKQAAKAKDPDDKRQLLEKLYRVVEEIPEIPRAPLLVTTDSTPEQLGVLLADNSERLSWLSSEGGLFDMLAGRYSGGIPNLDIMLKAHAGDHERVNRGSRPPVYLRRPALTVGLSPQHAVLRGLAQKPEFRGRGLLARFLYLLPDSLIGSRTLDGPPMPSKVEKEYSDLLTRILNREETNHPRVVELSEDAYAEWRLFALHIEAGMAPGGEFETIKDWASKLPGAAARIAGLFHVAECDPPELLLVDRGTMGRALELAAILSRHALAAFGIMGSDPAMDAARHVWEWVERTRAEKFKTQECWQALKGRFARMTELREALLVLVERGYLTELQAPPKGPGRRPSPIYRVSAEASEGWK